MNRFYAFRLTKTDPYFKQLGKGNNIVCVTELVSYCYIQIIETPSVLLRISVGIRLWVLYVYTIQCTVSLYFQRLL